MEEVIGLGIWHDHRPPQHASSDLRLRLRTRLGGLGDRFGPLGRRHRSIHDPQRDQSFIGWFATLAVLYLGRRWFVRPRTAVMLLTALLAFFGLSLGDPRFAAVATAPDNIAVLAMFGLQGILHLAGDRAGGGERPADFARRAGSRKGVRPQGLYVARSGLQRVDLHDRGDDAADGVVAIGSRPAIRLRCLLPRPSSRRDSWTYLATRFFGNAGSPYPGPHIEVTESGKPEPSNNSPTNSPPNLEIRGLCVWWIGRSVPSQPRSPEGKLPAKHNSFPVHWTWDISWALWKRSFPVQRHRPTPPSQLSAFLAGSRMSVMELSGWP